MQALCYLPLIHYASGAIGPTSLAGYGFAPGTAEQMYSFSFDGNLRLLFEEELSWLRRPRSGFMYQPSR